MAMVIDNEYNHGDIVYIKTDRDQLPRIVYCIKVYKNEITYSLSCGTVVSEHYPFELSREVNILTTSTN